MEALASWATPAIVVALFLWLRADIRNLRQDLSSRMDLLDKRIDVLDKRIDSLEARLDKRMDGFDERLRALEAGFAELRGEMRFVRDYIMRRNELPGAVQGDD